MSTESAQSFLDELPAIEKKYVYTPVAVFGYIGYVRGFEAEMHLPIPPASDFYDLITPTPLIMILFTIVIISLMNSFLDRGELDTHSLSLKLLADLGLFLWSLSWVIHIMSVYAIYASGIYTETILGLGISIYQVLIVAGFVSSVITKVIFSLSWAVVS